MQIQKKIENIVTADRLIYSPPSNASLFVVWTDEDITSFSRNIWLQEKDAVLITVFFPSNQKRALKHWLAKNATLIKTPSLSYKNIYS